MTSLRNVLAALAVVVAGSAQAATVSSLGALPTAFPSIQATSFQNFGNGGYQHSVTGNNFAAGCATAGNCRRSVWEGTSQFSTGVYDSISRGAASFTLSGLFNSVALLWGSADAHNIIEFYNNGQLVDSIDGGTVANSVSGYSTNSMGSRTGAAYVQIDSRNAFDSFVLKTTGIAFEFGLLQATNPVAAPVPVPAAGLMMLAGLAGLGFAARKRKAA